ATLGSAKFAALHQALVSSGTFLYVPRGVEIELPIEIFHWLNDENDSAFPHLLLVTDELAKVTVIEHFRSVNEHAPGFACGVNDLVAGPGATVTYVCAQNWAENVIALQKSQQAHRRRRPQRSACCRGRQTPAGIRCAHTAGPCLDAYRKRSPLQ